MSRPPGDCSQDYNISVFFSQLSFFKMFPAKRHVAFIGAQHDLCALSDDLAIRKPGVAPVSYTHLLNQQECRSELLMERNRKNCQTAPWKRHRLILDQKQVLYFLRKRCV